MSPLLDDLFRREAGRLVAALTRALGPGELTLAEDAVQEAMLSALQAWPARGVPADPAAWLFRTAKNRALDALRRRGAAERSIEVLGARMVDRPRDERPDGRASDRPIDDDVLAMMFMCCHPALPREARVVLTLKVVAGLGTGEVARGLLTTTDAIAQRLVRAKRTLRDLQVELVLPRADELPARAEAVLEVLYLVFTEGHVAAAGAELVRGDLCDEALRLGELLAATPGLDSPEVDALLALFHLVRARQPARVGPDGQPVLLNAQDRAAWDPGHLARGFERLARSARGEALSRWHLEAEIAACHAAAPSVEATDWARIVALYDELLARWPTPVMALNRAVALGRVRGAEAALAALEPLELPGYHLLFATRAGLLLELGRRDEAIAAYREALACPCSEPERRLLEARLAASSAAGMPPGTTFKPEAPPDVEATRTANDHLDRGLHAEDEGDEEGALKHYQAALKACSGLGVPALEAEALDCVARCSFGSGDFDRAAQLAGRAAELLKDSSDLVGRAAVLRHLGLVLRRKGDPEDAIGPYERALQDSLTAGDLEGAIEGRIGLANALVETTRWGEAQRQLDDAQAAASTPGYESLLADVLYARGDLHQRLGDPQAAVVCYLRGVELMGRAGDDEGQIALVIRLADAYEDLGMKRERVTWLRRLISLDARFRPDELVGDRALLREAEEQESSSET